MTRGPAGAGTAWRAATLLVALCLMLVGWPIAGVVGQAFAAPSPPRGLDLAVNLPLLARSVGWSILIAALATAAAFPTAWATRTLSDRWLAVPLVPLLMPSYLVYSGLGLVRAPGTWLGDELAEAGGEWPLHAGRILAVVGLAMWAWPLAWLIVGSGVRLIDRGIFDAVRLDGMGPLARLTWSVSIVRSRVLAALAAVALVMLGSAVPMHLAQLETYAIRLWRLLDETPHAEHWRVWLGGWPLIAVALAGGWWAGGRLVDSTGEPMVDRGKKGVSRATMAWSVALLAVSVAVPAALFAANMRHASALLTFWPVNGPAFLSSAASALVTGLLAVGVVACVWIAASGTRPTKRIARWSVAVFLASGLTPGILVGSAIATAWNGAAPLRLLAETPAIVVVGHLARFAFVPAIAGLLLARSEPPDLRSLRALDGALGFGGWCRAALPLSLGPVVAIGLATGLLAFHEIEAAVLLQPPGIESFARRMLEYLHFNRMDDLVVAGLYVIAGGLVIALVVAFLARDWRTSFANGRTRSP